MLDGTVDYRPVRRASRRRIEIGLSLRRLSDRGHHLAGAYLFPIIFQHCFDESRPPSIEAAAAAPSSPSVFPPTAATLFIPLGLGQERNSRRQVPTERADHYSITLKRWPRFELGVIFRGFGNEHIL